MCSLVCMLLHTCIFAFYFVQTELKSPVELLQREASELNVFLLHNEASPTLSVSREVLGSRSYVLIADL